MLDRSGQYFPEGRLSSYRLRLLKVEDDLQDAVLAFRDACFGILRTVCLPF